MQKLFTHTPAQHDHCEHRGTSERPALQVRFQSRVRIAAGIGRRLRRFSDGLPSNASSISESTSSSSISVPLRTPDSEGTRGWAPLGRRISQLASRADAVHGNTTRGRCRVNENGSIRNKSRSLSFPDSENERTRLVSFYNGYSYTTNAHRHSQEAWRKQVADVTFGKWPWRLFNRHVRAYRSDPFAVLVHPYIIHSVVVVESGAHPLLFLHMRRSCRGGDVT